MRTHALLFTLAVAFTAQAQTIKGRIYSPTAVVIATTSNADIDFRPNGKYKIHTRKGEPVTIVFSTTGATKAITIPGEIMGVNTLHIDVTMKPGQYTVAVLTEDQYGFLRINENPATKLW